MRWGEWSWNPLPIFLDLVGDVCRWHVLHSYAGLHMLPQSLPNFTTEHFHRVSLFRPRGGGRRARALDANDPAPPPPPSLKVAGKWEGVGIWPVATPPLWFRLVLGVAPSLCLGLSLVEAISTNHPVDPHIRGCPGHEDWGRTPGMQMHAQ